MSLANDIIKRVFGPVNPPAQARKAEPKPVIPQKKPATLADNKRGINLGCVQREFYGVEYNKRKNRWRARIKTSINGSINLGEFSKRKRAAVAVQLYMLWYRRGFIDIPTGKYLTCS